ncbi:hypothetical protein F4823DRAFT_558220 [Ustulina deusta]|nr:hypothetical protein F4823DRAFT_558220 [Ustulina deusta]
MRSLVLPFETEAAAVEVPVQISEYDNALDGKRHDELRVSSVNSFDKVQGLFSSTRASAFPAAAPKELTTLAHSLEKRKILMDFVSMKPPTDNAIFWGLIGLMPSQSEEGIAPRGPRILHIICKNIEFLNKYRGKAANLPEIRDTYFHIGNSLLSFLIATINFIREDMLYYSSGKL